MLIVVIFIGFFVFFCGAWECACEIFPDEFEKRILAREERDRCRKATLTCLKRFRATQYGDEADLLAQAISSYSKASGYSLEDFGTSQGELGSKYRFPSRPKNSQTFPKEFLAKRIGQILILPVVDLIRGTRIWLSCKDIVCDGCPQQVACWKAGDILWHWLFPALGGSVMLTILIDFFGIFFVDNVAEWGSAWSLFCHFLFSLGAVFFIAYVDYIINSKWS